LWYCDNCGERLHHESFHVVNLPAQLFLCQ
jgi:hypothetical protein